MTVTGVPAAWYDDPHVPGQVRYFDGAQWTQHTAPAPIAAVAPVAQVAQASPYGEGASWPADPSVAAAADQYTVVPGGWAPHQGSGTQGSGTQGSVTQGHETPGYGAHGYRPTASPGWSTRKLGLVIGAAVLAGLVVLGAIAGLVRLGESRNLASGPPLALADSAPVTVVGRTVASTPASVAARAQMTPLITNAFAGLPGSGPSRLEIYGPGGRSAPVRGTGYVVLVWMRVTTPFDQNAFATGMARGLSKASGGATSQSFTEANGGKTVCVRSTPAALDVPMVECGWVRSGTGLVVTIEYDVPVDVVLADNRAVVASMAHLA